MERVFEVVVLDEIQMIGDENRGWAWCNALLGESCAGDLGVGCLGTVWDSDFLE